MSAGFEIRLRQKLGAFELSLDIEQDRAGVTGIFGPSGSGKTSLIRAIAGLSQPQESYIRIGERVMSDSTKGLFIKPHLRRVGCVFQDARLFPHMSVVQNLSYGAGGATEQIGAVTELLGLERLLQRAPASLSGGEAQRVAIGRALLSQPDVLLMDEPLSALDEARRDDVLPYIERLHHFAKIQIFYVSHAMSEVARLADTLVLMRDGAVRRVGDAAELLADPSILPEIGVRQAGAVLHLVLERPDAGDGLSQLKSSAGEMFLPKIDAPAGSRLRVRVLASDVILARSKPAGLSALNILPATVLSVQEGTGPGVAVALALGEDRLIARITRKSARALELREGVSCFAIIKSVSVARGNVGQDGPA